MLSTDASGKGASLVAAVVQKQKDELTSEKQSQKETKVEFTLMWKKAFQYYKQIKHFYWNLGIF